MQRVQIRRRRASGLSMALAFLIVSLIFYISTLAVSMSADSAVKEIRPAGSSARKTVELTLAGGEAWLVHFGKFQSAEEARIQAAKLINRGSAGYLYKDDSFYAAGNAYADEAEAEACAKRLSESGIPAETKRIRQESVRIRLTATQAQSDAFQNAFTALSAQEDSLFQIAEALDAGLSMNQAKARIAICVHEFEPFEAEIKSAVGESDDFICSRLKSLCASALSEMKDLTKGRANEMYLASAVRHAAMSMKVSRFAFLKNLQ